MNEATDPPRPGSGDDEALDLDLREASRAPDAQRSEVGELFTAHNRALLAFLKARVSPEEAHEVAQEAYVKLLGLDSTPATGFLRAYLFKVASNLLIDRLRRKSVETRVVKTFESLWSDSDNRDPERYVLAREGLQNVREYLNELQPNFQEAYFLGRIDGLSQARIATTLGVTPRQVRHYLRYALLYCRLRAEGFSASETHQQLKKTVT